MSRTWRKAASPVGSGGFCWGCEDNTSSPTPVPASLTPVLSSPNPSFDRVVDGRGGVNQALQPLTT